MSNKNEKKNAEISARVGLIIENAGDSPNGFAKTLGYARAQTVYDILNGKAAPSYDFFNKFALSEYSVKYDLHWLLTGQGNMLRDEQPAPMVAPPTVIYERDPRDIQLIVAQEKTIARDEELIASLRQIIGNLEHGSIPRGFSAPSAKPTTPPSDRPYPHK